MSTTGVAAGRRGMRRSEGGWAAIISPPNEFRMPAARCGAVWPWGAAPKEPATGVPLGHDPDNRAAVCADPITWFDAGLLSRPSVLVTGAAGAGKSALVQRWVIGLAATGVQPVVLGDPKGEYAPAIDGLGGQVIRIGRGIGGLNVLEHPGLAGVAQQPAHVAAQLREAAHRRRLTMVCALLDMATDDAPGERDRSVIDQALRELSQRDPDNPAPGLDDLVRALRSHRGDRVARMINTLNSLIHHYGEVLGRTTTEPLDPEAPAVSFDTSAINQRDELLLTASLLACASHLDAHAETERITGSVARRRWIVRDWSALPTLDRPGFGAALTRLTAAQSTTGTATVLVDPDQHPQLPHAPGQMSAIGTPQALETLRRRLALSDSDTSRLGEWMSQPQPGRFLLKRDLIPGTAVQVDLTDVERHLLEAPDAVVPANDCAIDAVDEVEPAKEPAAEQPVAAVEESIRAEQPVEPLLFDEPAVEPEPPIAQQAEPVELLIVGQPTVEPEPPAERVEPVKSAQDQPVAAVDTVALIDENHEPAQPSRTKPALIGIAALAVALIGGTAVIQLSRPTQPPAPPIAQPVPPAGGGLAVAAPAPAAPGAGLVVAADVPAAPGGRLAIAAAAPAVPGGRIAVAFAAPPRTYASLIVAADVPRYQRLQWLHEVSWSDAADWEQRAEQARLAATSGYEPSAPYYPSTGSYTGTAETPQYVAPQGAQSYAPAPQPVAPAPGGGGGTSTEPGPPAPNQVFDPTNPDSQP